LAAAAGGAPARPLHSSAAAAAHWRATPAPKGAREAPAARPADPQGRLVNAEVTARTVRLVAADGTHTVLRLREAQAAARAAGLDLVQVDGTAEPPVCRLLDFEALRAGERQREKDGRRRAVERRKGDVTKEVRLSLRTAEHDLRVKAAQAARALEAGHRAKCVVIFKGGVGKAAGADAAARTHAAGLLEQLRAAVQAEAGGEGAPQLARLDTPPKMEGSALMWCVLAPAQRAGAPPPRDKKPRDTPAAGAAPEQPQQRSGREEPEDIKLGPLEATVLIVSHAPAALPAAP
jgi:translation initiation factor IF-3